MLFGRRAIRDAGTDRRRLGRWCSARAAASRPRRGRRPAGCLALRTSATAASSATSSVPVELPMNIFTPAHPGSRSKAGSSSVFSGVAPIKKAMSTQARASARRHLSARSAAPTVGGLVFGISKTAVTPPIAAAAVPVAMSSLCSSPGSRKCTCVSITPGKTCSPPQSRYCSASTPPRSPNAAMRSSRTPTSVRSTPPGVATIPARKIKSKDLGIRAPVAFDRRSSVGTLRRRKRARPPDSISSPGRS